MVWWNRKNRGTQPAGYKDTVLAPSPSAQYFYQEKQNWQYPSVPAHEQRSALVNNWTGNQMPGYTNFIPHVALSNFTWNVPTSYANTLKNQQYNKGFNIGGYSSVQNAALQKSIQQAWQNRVKGV